MTFGERVRHRRQSLNMTLADLAAKLNKTEATIQRYESGSIKDPPHNMVVKLSKVLNCDPNYLMGWIDEENPTESKPTFAENDDERDLLAYFRSFDRRGQHELMGKLYEIANSRQSDRK